MFHLKRNEVTLLLYTPVMAVRSFWFDILGESMIDTRVGNLAVKLETKLWIVSVELGCRAFECLNVLEINCFPVTYDTLLQMESTGIYRREINVVGRHIKCPLDTFNFKPI